MKPLHRHDFPYYVRDLGLTGTCVEVGVAEGKFADEFLRRWQDSYAMVDRWCHIDGYDDIMNGPDEEHELRYRQAMDVRARHGSDRIRVLRMDSVAAAAEFSDKSLPFVYLDGDHSYDGLRRDFAAWWPKVKPGGVIAGHDYYDKPPFAVRSALCSLVNGPCGVTHEACPSWWIHVP
jgi:hypothetical protein